MRWPCRCKGRTGGRYEILGRIGGGGMAVVYKAIDSLLHRHVAIKVLSESLSNNSEFIRRFDREAQAAASLSHPNVVNVYDVGRDGYTHYIVMELVDGPTLKQHILDNGPLPVEEAVHIAVQICDGLSHAHENQIVHRDIKPHNILIGSNGRVKGYRFWNCKGCNLFNHYANGIRDGIRSLLFTRTSARWSCWREIGYLFTWDCAL